ncbi:carotenoid biosynthesis protein [Methanoculleus sp. FWC-SCC1]|uniref:Carotenoid biosynthesis protein n=1 Tax=Methanoculleus frigidifontis TaxID=2584085 RepID=A0ABT8MA12_9EURY|nr:carotenoid biosynthesis protein [Methanoculleus sp. FWC-SCC1]MDN7024778.1 carotenoid biosynthesis protein [Methanoculleus sp. FWC-SCC1]
MQLSVRWGLLSVALILFLAGYLVVRFDAPDLASVVSVIFLIGLALPSYIALVRWLGAVRGIGLLVLLSLLPLLVEAYAVATGVPYGRFTYSPHLGDPLFDLVPWTVAFAYLPMLLGAVTVASAAVGTAWYRLIPAGTLLLLLIDLVIDPAAVHAGLWVWAEEGAYYGVPVSNFAGWVLTGAAYIGLISLIAARKLAAARSVPGMVASSLLLILAFWIGYLAQNGLLIPAFLGAGLFAATCLVVFRDDSPRE